MDKFTRVFNAMDGKPVDRVPVTFYHHFFDLADNSVALNVDWVKRTGMDLLAFEPDGFYQVQWNSGLQTLDAWKQYRVHDKEDYYIAGQMDRARRIVDGLKGDTPVYAMLFTPFSYVKHTYGGGQARVMDLWREDTQAFKAVMNVLEEENRLLIDEYAKTGISGFMISMQSAEKWRFTPEEYRANLTEYDKRLIDYANQKFDHNIVHLCSWGNEPNHMEVWRDYPIKTVNWGVYQEENLTLKQGRSYFGPDVTLMGGFDRLAEGVLYSGNKEMIQFFTKHILSEVGQQRLILSADCSIQDDTPDEHIRWVIEAAEQYALENPDK